jgi:hypothetical protein
VAVVIKTTSYTINSGLYLEIHHGTTMELEFHTLLFEHTSNVVRSIFTNIR